MNSPALPQLRPLAEVSPATYDVRELARIGTKAGGWYAVNQLPANGPTLGLQAS